MGSFPESGRNSLGNATATSPKIRIEVRVKQKPSSSEPKEPREPKEAVRDVKPKSSASAPSAVPKQKLSVQELNNYLEHNVGSYNHISSFQDLPVEFGYNQHISIDNELRELLRAQLWKFEAPIKYAFAYGSGVFSQGKSKKKTTEQPVSLIFGVSYPDHWHSLNMRQNPHHYSALRRLGSDAVTFVQEHIGAGLYFNAPVDMGGVKIKYGVVSMKTLLQDLHKWDSLFLAGRLHKPVKILRDEPRARLVNQSNLLSAVRTALLILPEEFTELDLYSTIAGISYMGDAKAAVRQNREKVGHIVTHQFLNFRNLYSPLLDLLPNVSLTSSSHMKLEGTEIPVALMKQDMDPVRRGNMVCRLPSEFRKNLYMRYQSKFKSASSIGSLDNMSSNELIQGTLFDQEIAADPNLTSSVSKAVHSTVFWPSLAESSKEFITAGFGRTVRMSGGK